MQGGFSFCGVDVARFGLEYVPTLDQTYVFAGGGREIHQETFDGHDGGYFYGVTAQPKEFTLRCFYHDQHIAHGVLTAIENFFKVGKTGKLVFDKRDWIWYTATVTNVDLGDIRNHHNGFVTIYMRAFYPYGRHDYISLNDTNYLDDYIAANSGLLSEEKTPPVSFSNINENTDILLYNGGTEKAGVAVAIAGEACEGITIINKTTGQTARFVAFTYQQTTNVNKYIVSDSINGKTIITDGSTSSNGFLYHDYGFIELTPSYPIERDIYVSYQSGTDRVSVIGDMPGYDVIGRHIHLAGEWRKIIDRTDEYLVVDTIFENAGSCCTDIVQMNEISIELSPGAEITKLDFIYKPTFQ